MFSGHPRSLFLMSKDDLIDLCAECERFTRKSDINKFSKKLQRFKMTRAQKRIISGILLDKYLTIFNPPAENKIFPELRMRRYDASQYYSRRPREEHHPDFAGISWVALAAGLGNITAVGICDRAGGRACHKPSRSCRNGNDSS